jgi:hypothetical protein
LGDERLNAWILNIRTVQIPKFASLGSTVVFDLPSDHHEA